ncbi:fungal hydrophobin-domain-containing protein [Xylariaceae sp. FL0255]|nr:fungal hydrophobin-domain-containing protein [Xylariaceae sp. FL0255]
MQFSTSFLVAALASAVIASPAQLQDKRNYPSTTLKTTTTTAAWPTTTVKPTTTWKPTTTSPASGYPTTTTTGGAWPTTTSGSGSGGSGGYDPCTAALYSQPQCCSDDVLGVADVDCASPTAVPSSPSNFAAICAASGQTARCCVIPVLGQAVLCDTPVGL